MTKKTGSLYRSDKPVAEKYGSLYRSGRFVAENIAGVYRSGRFAAENIAGVYRSGKSNWYTGALFSGGRQPDRHTGSQKGTVPF